MSYRLTDTNKWNDKWFLDLRPIEKLLFNYLVDNCDCAGFIELNIRKWANEIGNNSKDIEGALKGLVRGFIYSDDKECIFLRKFLKHQKHYPLKESDNAFKGIISRFENYRYKFNIEDINEFIQGASEGLRRGNDNDNDIGNDKDIKESINISNSILDTWRGNFELYKVEVRNAFKNIVTKEYILDRESYHFGLDIKKTIEKACKDYWILEIGWKNKKASKSKEIDWKSTFNKSLSNKMNQVWKSKESKEEKLIYNRSETPEILNKFKTIQNG
jgi:hypothetical protein